MRRLVSFCIWSTVFLVVLGGIDQFFVRVPVANPALKEVRTFYLDFRHRLLGVAEAPEPSSLEAVLEPSERGSDRARPEPAPRYLYVDGKGDLHFAERLEEIPPHLRDEARPLEQ